jgi:transcriptional regulatory protein LevR
MIKQIEESLKIKIHHDAQIGILIHVSFLIDKLKHNGNEITFKNLNDYRYEHNKEFILVKKSLRALEQTYEVNIGEDELAYIVRMIVENIVTV